MFVLWLLFACLTVCCNCRGIEPWPKLPNEGLESQRFIVIPDIQISVNNETLTAPELPAPDLQAPDLQGPELEAPDLQGPDLEAPDLQGPDLEAPDLIQAPDLQAPDLQGPDLQAPDLQGPDLQAPEWEAPDLQGPELEAPSLEAPEFPCIGFGCGEPPATTASDIDGMATSYGTDFPNDIGGLEVTTDFPDSGGMEEVNTVNTEAAPTTTAAPERCYDHLPLCGYFWLRWMCDDPLMFWFKVGCPKTCNICYGEFCKSLGS